MTFMMYFGFTVLVCMHVRLKAPKTSTCPHSPTSGLTPYQVAS